MTTTKLLTLVASLAMALLALPAMASAADRDHDGMNDRWEKVHHVGKASADVDRDHVDNRNEFREGTNPRDKDSNDNGRSDGREDSDHDGLNNAAEDATGNDPRDRDTDDDGVLDGREQAGTVTAFANNELTITLANGTDVTATVTDATEVECKTENEVEDHHGEHGASAARDGNGDNNDDHGDDTAGDDNDHNGDMDNSDDCPAGALKVGAKVHEASLKVTAKGKVWEDIELVA